MDDFKVGAIDQGVGKIQTGLIHSFTSMVRFDGSVRWFGSMVRFDGSVRWLGRRCNADTEY
jgi:hypothetical protein